MGKNELLPFSPQLWHFYVLLYSIISILLLRICMSFRVEKSILWSFLYIYVLFRIEDGIVLSPQRQSFVQGCHIPQSASERILPQERGKSGLSRTSDREREGRSRLTGRVGKGRLDYKERPPLQERNKVHFYCYLLSLYASSSSVCRVRQWTFCFY